MVARKTMEVGKTYYYEVDYLDSVKCIKQTPTSYRVELPSGKTLLVGLDSILDLKEL